MVGKVFTVAQQKGGAGKTTLAAHLAVAWSQSGLRVAVVDIDPQGSLTYWFQTRSKALDNVPGLVHSQITGWRTQKEVDRLSRENDVVVIDSPPHAETEAKIAVRVASLVLVPVQPSPMDLWATKPTLELARAEKVRALLVFNRVPARGNLVETLIAQTGREFLAPPAVDIATQRIGNRIGYAGALMEGRAVTEMDAGSRAAEEIKALAEEILRRAQ
ncbi:chromosome partitioning protein [uncultured Gammaproteobacteria bacterium]